MENFNYTIGNRTRDLPACSTVPQPTAPPRTPRYVGTELYYYIFKTQSKYAYTSHEPQKYQSLKHLLT